VISDDGDYHRGHGSTAVAQPANRQNRSHGGSKIIDEVVADEDHGEQPVRAFEQGFNPAGRFLSLTGKMSKAVAVNGHHAGFTAGEEGRGQNQNNQGANQPPVRVGIQRKYRLSASRPAIVRAGGLGCQGEQERVES